jgi:uncharacterized membrane protein
MRRSPTVVGFVAVFVVLVCVTVAGIAVNWPSHRTIPGSAGLRQPKTYGAEALATRGVPCRTPGARGCILVTIRLTGGPDDGRRATLRFGDVGGRVDVEVGDKLVVSRNPAPPAGTPAAFRPPPYAFSDFQRRGSLVWLALLFAVLAVAAGRFHGLRALVGLAASLATIVFFVVPAIADGRPPLQVAAFGGLGVMLLTIPLVHGGGAKSLAACLGTAAALLLTLGLADLWTRLAHLSGLNSDEAVYLQSTAGVSVRGLLLAGIVIAALGVLGDTTVTQASTVIALRRASPELGFRRLVAHATSVGRDHIAATINTLVLVYVGASLPLLIVFSIGGTSFGTAINGESVAEPIVATLVGSIGLIAAVPLTTALAAFLALNLPERRLRAEHVHAH